jgi:hypothetical protein
LKVLFLKGVKKSLSLFLLFSFLPSRGRARELKEKHRQKLHQLTGAFFNIKTCRITGLRTIKIDEINIVRQPFEIHVQQVQITIRIRTILHISWLLFKNGVSKIWTRSGKCKDDKPENAAWNKNGAALTGKLNSLIHFLQTRPVRAISCTNLNCKITRSVAVQSLQPVSPLLAFEIQSLKVFLEKAVDFVNEYPLAVQLITTDVLIAHAASAGKPTPIAYFELNMFARSTRYGFGLSEESWGKFNSIPFVFYADYRLKDAEHATLFVEIPDISPSEILQSFPFFHYKPIYQINAEGLLNFRAILKFDINSPLKHYFNANLDQKDLHISNPEAFNLDYLKTPFTHRVYDIGNYVKDILLDSDNQLFASLDTISPKMINAVICTEDPSFLSHKGIDKFLFGYALVTNIASKKFSRGGSTITMQLVRNLLLNHKKNIYRKIEEIILTWLIEEIVCLPKRRILEIYLNIIEWGPNIYGISDASRFYFFKPPEKLSLTESLVLSYIIPRPKFFCDAVKSQSPQLKTNLRKHIQTYSTVMRKRGFATDDDIASINYTIQFAGDLGSLELGEPNN